MPLKQCLLCYPTGMQRYDKRMSQLYMCVDCETDMATDSIHSTCCD